MTVTVIFEAVKRSKFTVSIEATSPTEAENIVLAEDFPFELARLVEDGEWTIDCVAS